MDRIKKRFSLEKKSEVCFISHLNLLKTISRAVRRAGLPVVFSRGYHPRPRISAGSALAVGLTSQAEYFDIELKRDLGDREFMKLLNRELPPGLVVHRVCSVPLDSDSLMAIINRALYRIRLRWACGEKNLEEDSIRKMIRRFLDREEIVITRQRKKGPRDVDLKPMIYRLELESASPPVLEALVQTGSAGNVRTEELFEAFTTCFPFSTDYNPTDIHRRGLFVFRDGRLLTPFEL